MSTPTPQNDAKKVANRAMVQAAVLAAVVLLSIVAWLAFDFLLLLFASILFGVLIHGVSQWISDRTSMPYKAAMPLFFVVMLLGLGGEVGWSRQTSPSKPMPYPTPCHKPSSNCANVPSSCLGPTNCCNNANALRTLCPTAPAPSTW